MLLEMSFVVEPFLRKRPALSSATRRRTCKLQLQARSLHHNAGCSLPLVVVRASRLNRECRNSACGLSGELGRVSPQRFVSQLAPPSFPGLPVSRDPPRRPLRLTGHCSQRQAPGHFFTARLRHRSGIPCARSRMEWTASGCSCSASARRLVRACVLLYRISSFPRSSQGGAYEHTSEIGELSGRKTCSLYAIDTPAGLLSSGSCRSSARRRMGGGQNRHPQDRRPVSDGCPARPDEG